MDKEVIFSFLPISMIKLALSPGSSMQGKAFRAAVAWNWVVASHLNKMSETKMSQTKLNACQGDGIKLIEALMIKLKINEKKAIYYAN